MTAAPDALLCRLAPAANKDVVQLGIGRVASLRCNALFSPARDEAIRFEAPACRACVARGPLSREGPGAAGSGRREGFHETEARPEVLSAAGQVDLRPAPAGWCSWYIFYQDVREDADRGQHPLAGGESEEVRLPVRADRRRLAGRRPRDGRESRLVRHRKAEIPPRNEMAGRLHPRPGFQAGHLADPLYHQRCETVPVAAGLVSPPARRNQRLRDPRSQDREGGDRLVRPVRD